MVLCFFYDCVFVCCIDEDEKIVGGIIIFDIVKEKFMEGEIIVVGEGVRDEDGDCILMDVS